jgi:hypothetical protein
MPNTLLRRGTLKRWNFCGCNNLKYLLDDLLQLSAFNGLKIHHAKLSQVSDAIAYQNLYIYPD